MLVAVVGLGSVGMIALKNFLEEGLDVVGFEKGVQVGGLWVRNEDESVTCALKETRANWSKHRMCTGDFPHLDSTSLHLNQQELADWHQRYAEHFDLLPHIKFHATVLSIDLLGEADDDEARFEITFFNKDSETPQVMVVDKVFLSTGLQSKPFVPEIPGMEKCGGVVKHSQGFKSGVPFKEKRVVVVGSRSSASDVCEALVKEDASEVFLPTEEEFSLFVPRFWGGKTLDYYFSRRASNILDALDSLRPCTSRWFMNGLEYLMSTTSFKLDPKWALRPFPDIVSGVPTISDTIIPLLESGQITSVPIVSSISSSNSVTLSDGTVLENIDAIIFATGYEVTKPTLLSPSVLARMAPPSFVDVEIQDGFESEGFPMLYKGALPPSLPSLAMSIQGLLGPAISDVKSMWIAGVWSEKISLASEEEMWKNAKKDKAWWIGLKQFNIKPYPGRIPLGPSMTFFAREAGCQIDEHLSWTSLSAWKWWLSGNVKFSSMLLDGMASASVYRLWGRHRWEVARETIEKANRKENYSKVELGKG